MFKDKLHKEDIQRIKEQFGFSALETAEFSTLLILQLILGSEKRIISIFQILDEIKTMEGVKNISFTKPASQFRDEPLKGFWHKHYYQPCFLFKNLILNWELNKQNSQKVYVIINKVLDESGEEYLNEKVARKIASNIVTGGLMERLSNRNLTGEWIIFKKHKGKNYYLTLGSHKELNSRKENDYQIYNRMLRSCSWEFPFLFQK